MNILEQFSEKVLKYPNKVCLFDPDKSFSYLQLDLYSNQIANCILKNSSKKIVPLYIKRDIHILPIILALFKLGRIPLPLSTSLSYDQVLKRIEDIDYDIVICDDDSIQAYNCLKIPKENFSKEETITKTYFTYNQSDVAYIICTSGSTGIPKKVFLTYRNIEWLLNEFYSLVDFSTQSTFLFTTPYTFDVSITEIFSPILTEGKLCCFTSSNNVERLRSTMDYVNKFNITHMSLPPTYAELLIDFSTVDMFSNLEYLCLAGEKFEVRLAKKFEKIINNGTSVLNLYGPSETTIYSTYYNVSGREKIDVPIGKPLNGCEVKILYNNNCESESGELYISGSGVSKGYLLDEKLTAEKFVICDSKTFYKTGDYVHLDMNGQLVFDNRKDNQVKINGIRIELGEIESEVLNLNQVQQCKAVYHKGKIIIFYQTYSDKNDDIKNNIKSILPNYLKPVLIEVSEFLVNQNRKFDTKTMIKKYYQRSSNISQDFIKNKVESILRNLDIYEFDNMDSLNTVRFFSHVEDVFDIQISDSQIAKLENIEETISFISEKIASNNSPQKIVNKDNYDEYQIYNLVMALQNSSNNLFFEDELIPTMFMQKQYNLKKYNSILSVDFEYYDFSFESLKNIEKILKRLSNEIDILRMVPFQKDGKLYFRKIKKDYFIPVICVLNEIMDEASLKRIFYDNYEVQQFLTLVYPKYNKIIIYFSHNIMDKGSLFIFSRYFNLAIQEKEIIFSKNNYEKYISFIKKQNSNLNMNNVLNSIPETKLTIPKFRNHKKGRALLMVSKLISDTDSLAISCEAIFKFAKYVFSISQATHQLTGSFVANIRDYYEFDANNIVGDVHSNILFSINANQSFESFKDSVNLEIDKIKRGSMLRDKIFDGYPSFSGIYGAAKNKLESLNFSFNYIGEVKEINETILSIFEDNLPKKYIVSFTNKGNLYLLICNDELIATNVDFYLGDKYVSLDVKDIFDN